MKLNTSLIACRSVIYIVDTNLLTKLTLVSKVQVIENRKSGMFKVSCVLHVFHSWTN